MNTFDALDLLGRKAKDKVTGFEGIVATIYFDLYGCVQSVLTPQYDPKSDNFRPLVFDISRLDVDMESPRVMDPPDSYFSLSSPVGEKGPAERPEICI